MTVGVLRHFELTDTSKTEQQKQCESKENPVTFFPKRMGSCILSFWVHVNLFYRIVSYRNF